MWAMMALQIGKGVASYETEIAAGKSQHDMANYNAGVMLEGAKRQEQAMGAETTRMHAKARRMKASQLAQYAKSGAVPTAGTSLAVLAKQAGEMEMDILQRRRGRMLASENLKSEARLLKFQGDVARTQSRMRAISGAMGGAAGAAGSFSGGGGSSQQQIASPQQDYNASAYAYDWRA